MRHENYSAYSILAGNREAHKRKSPRGNALLITDPVIDGLGWW